MTAALRFRLLSVHQTTRLGMITTITVAVMILTMAGAVSLPTASGASSSPGWVVSSVAQPTNFSTGDNALCVREQFFLCDHYVLTLTNVGSGPTTGPVVIADMLPLGLRAVGMAGYNMEEGLRLESHG